MAKIGFLLLTAQAVLEELMLLSALIKMRRSLLSWCPFTMCLVSGETLPYQERQMVVLRDVSILCSYLPSLPRDMDLSKL